MSGHKYNSRDINKQAYNKNLTPKHSRNPSYESMNDNNINNNDKLQIIELDIQEVKGIMKDNMEKVMDRGMKIDEIEKKSDELDVHALKFRKNATNLKIKFLKENMKLICVIVLIIVAILTLIILVATRK